jgi:hypothetical protein
MIVKVRTHVPENGVNISTVHRFEVTLYKLSVYACLIHCSLSDLMPRFCPQQWCVVSCRKLRAGQEAGNSIERWLMSLAGFSEVFDGLWLTGLDEVDNAEFGDRADRAAEGGSVQNAIELFRFLLGHDFHLECCGTL